MALILVVTGKFSPHPPKSPKLERPSSRQSRMADRPESAFPDPIIVTKLDSGRKNDLPQCPIIIVLGGPGSGRKDLCKRLVTNRPSISHIDMGNLIRSKIQLHSEVKWINEADKLKSGQLISDVNTHLHTFFLIFFY